MTFPPIDSHGFLSDTHTTALVGPDGGVDWLCTPAADGPSLFARLLDRERGGSWRIGVEGGHVTGQEYEGDSFVLTTRWEGPDGAAEVVDLLAVDTGDDPEDPEDPEDPDPRHLLLRLARCTGGTVRVVVDVDARPDYARTAVAAGRRDVGRGGVRRPAAARRPAGGRRRPPARWRRPRRR